MGFNVFGFLQSVFSDATSQWVAGIIKGLRVTPRKALYWVPVIVALVAGWYAAYATIQAVGDQKLVPREYLFILLGLVAPWGAIIVGFWHLSPRSMVSSQYAGKSSVKTKSGRICAHRLHDASESDVLDLNWTTFSDGLDFLIQQLRFTGGGPDLVVGVNNAGGAIAALLAGKVGRDNPLPVGNVITKGTHCPPGCLVASLPQIIRMRADAGDGNAACNWEVLEKSRVNRILVADMMVRRGRGIQDVVNLLTHQYEPTKIFVADLAATRVSRGIASTHELHKDSAGAFDADLDLLPDFLAFTCPNDRVRLPYDIQ